MSYKTMEAIAHWGDRQILAYADRQIIASVLNWDMQGEVGPDEVETIAIAYDIVWVKLTDNRAIPIDVETFRSIRRTQLDQVSEDAGVAFVMEIEAKLEADAIRAESIEVDSIESGLYRVWRGMTLIDIVRRCDYSGGWIAEPTSDYNPHHYQTAEQAIKAVIRAWNRAQAGVLQNEPNCACGIGGAEIDLRHLACDCS